MKKILRKNFRKRIAVLLLAVLLIPLLPIMPVFAQAEIPDFPYLSQSWYDTNTDSFALWEVHGSDNVSYVQTRTNVFSSGAFPVVYRSGLSWTGYFYYIDYSKIIDTWDKDGNHIDGGYSWNANIRIPKPNETTVNSEVYATLVYCNTDIYYGNGAGDNDIYAYQNFVVPSYADPTPTPAPEPEVDTKFPTFINAYKDNTLNNSNRGVTKYLVVNRYYDEANTRYTYQLCIVFQLFNPRIWGTDPVYTPKYNGYEFVNNTFTCYFPNIAPNHNYSGHYSLYPFSTTNYMTVNDIYDCTNAASGWPGFYMDESTERNYQFSISEPSMNYEATAVYLINSDGSTTRVDGDGGDTATPTPTVAPTAIPQPSISPVPTEPPDSGEDNNWTGLFGWLKRIRDSILNIPKKIVSGILDALKYLFLPDPDKVKSVFDTVSNKFGVQHPAKFTVDPNELFRPANVVWQFRPISLNGEETEAVDVTIINFEEVDEWLDSSPGMVITRILQAMFGITMFAYLIYIFTKHIATINYTDAHTLMHLDNPPQNQRGGSR